MRILGLVAGEVLREYSRTDGGGPYGDAFHEKRERKRQRRAENLEGFQRASRDISEIRRREAAAEQERRELDERFGGGPYPFDFLVEQHAAWAIALVRPYPPHREPGGRSHVGGRPDLPDGTDWPRDAEGRPLHFLAQVDLAEISRPQGRPGALPTLGTLLFFVRVDEELSLETKDQWRVLFDSQSAGRPSRPPDDLPPLDHVWARAFAAEGERAPSILPYWSWKPAVIRSIPDPQAFDTNAHHNHRLADYVAQVRRFRSEQIEGATGLSMPVVADPWWPDLGLFAGGPPRSPERLLPFEETGFPWTARGVVLASRSVLRAFRKFRFDAFRVELGAWLDQAEGLPAWAPVDFADAAAFIKLLNRVMEADSYTVANNEGVERTIYEKRAKLAVEAAVHRLVTEAGGNAALAARLPDSLYRRAYSRHAPIVGREDSHNVQHAQMFGYVPSSQDPLPVGSATQTLLQLPSDFGLGMIIGDMGELDFNIDPEALRDRNWGAVNARHVGR